MSCANCGTTTDERKGVFCSSLQCLLAWFVGFNPNTIKSYKIVQKLSPKHAARGVVQSPYSIYRHKKACLFEQPPWRAAGDPRLARSRSRVQALGPAARCARFFSLSSLPSSFGRLFFHTFTTKPAGTLGLIYIGLPSNFHPALLDFYHGLHSNMINDCISHFALSFPVLSRLCKNWHEQPGSPDHRWGSHKSYLSSSTALWS